MRFLHPKLHWYVVFIKKCLLPYFVWFSSPYTLENHFLPRHVSKDHEAKVVHPSSLRLSNNTKHVLVGNMVLWNLDVTRVTNKSNTHACLFMSCCLWKNLMCLNKFNYGKGSNPITNRDEPYNTQNPCLPN